MLIKTLPTFEKWFEKLKDRQTKIRIAQKIGALSTGYFGDSKSLGDGVSELRIHIGPGYRLYYTIRQSEIIFLLVGGDKSTQSADIAKAKQLAKEFL